MSFTKKKLFICLMAVVMILSSIIAVFVVNANDSQQGNGANGNSDEAQVISVFHNIEGCTFESEVKAPKEAMDEYTGVKITSPVGGKMSFRYNGIFDLSKSENFIKFLVLPQKMGTADIDNMTITLTDIYDENKYLTIFFFDGATFANEYHNSYMRCSESGKYVGLGYSWDGILNEAGTSSQLSFRGLVPARSPDWKAIALYFNTVNSQLRMRRSDYNTGRTWKTEYDYLVMDYLDKGLGENKFSGFTTNEVYVTVDVQALDGAKASLLVTEFGGLDVSGKEISKDNVEMTFDLKGYSLNNLPYGVAGENYTYPVFDALAYSPLNGVKKVNDVSVFYGPERISIIDGRFSTKKAGPYQIIYNVTLNNGQRVQKSIDVFVRDSYEQPCDYVFDSRIPEQVFIGTDKVYLYEGKAVGGSGDLIVEQTLLLNGEEVELNKDGLYSYFVPEIPEGNSSVYSLKYDVTDITGVTKTFVKEINVIVPNAPIISEPSVPKVVRVGYSISLPIPKAYSVDVAGNKTEVPVTLKINGENNNGIYTPSVAGNFTVSYHAGQSVLEYQVEALAAPTENNYNNWYFKPSGLTFKEVEKTGIWFTANNSGTPTLDFANTLCADNFSVGFDVSKGNVSEVRITLIDSINPNEKVEFDICNSNDGPVMYINNERIGFVTGSFDVDKGQYISFELYKNTIIGAVETIGEIKYYSNGERFNGFSSESVYFKIELVEYGENAELKMANINKQSFTKILDDFLEPIISLNKDQALIRSIDVGGDVFVSGAKAWDVYGSVSELKVEIYFTNLNGDTSLVYEGDIDEDYALSSEIAGEYSVHYYVCDSSYNSDDIYATVYIIDTEFPVIDSNFNLDDEYEVGDTITLSKIEAEDDSGFVDAYYCVITPAGEWKVLYETKGSYEYTFTKKGPYRIRMIAMDASKNVTYSEFELTVR